NRSTQKSTIIKLKRRPLVAMLNKIFFISLGQFLWDWRKLSRIFLLTGLSVDCHCSKGGVYICPAVLESIAAVQWWIVEQGHKNFAIQSGGELQATGHWKRPFS